jgi:hypothetical protein
MLLADTRMTSAGTPSILVKLNMAMSDSAQGDLVNAFLSLLSRDEKDFDIGLSTYVQYEFIHEGKAYALKPDDFEAWYKEHPKFDKDLCQQQYCLNFFAFNVNKQAERSDVDNLKREEYNGEITEHTPAFEFRKK